MQPLRLYKNDAPFGPSADSPPTAERFCATGTRARLRAAVQDGDPCARAGRLAGQRPARARPARRRAWRGVTAGGLLAAVAVAGGLLLHGALRSLQHVLPGGCARRAASQPAGRGRPRACRTHLSFALYKFSLTDSALACWHDEAEASRRHAARFCRCRLRGRGSQGQPG